MKRNSDLRINSSKIITRVTKARSIGIPAGKIAGIILRLILPLIALSGITACTAREKDDHPKNIILMIGDGMGLNQIHAGMVAKGGILNLEQCEFAGFQKTFASDMDITDSGAAGTAIACGVKTNKGYVGMDPAGSAVKSILEMARESGMSTGLLATSTITHATPAAFAAHNIDRGEYEEIAEDISRAGIDMIMGGGEYHFNRREDGQNLLDTMVSQGYFVSDRIEEIPEDHAGPVAILADTMALPEITRGRGDILVRATGIALERLAENPRGFFLMVEGSQIDWAAHKHDTLRMVAEIVDFDEAIGVALDFARNDRNTLVIVTADHETGGFTLLSGGPLEKKIKGSFSTEGHTGVMVPVFTAGPGAEEFGGIYDNTDIFRKMKMLLGL
jgi:alkaline phosphatase